MGKDRSSQWHLFVKVKANYTEESWHDSFAEAKTALEVWKMMNGGKNPRAAWVKPPIVDFDQTAKVLCGRIERP